MSFILFLATKKRTKSNIKAMKVMEAPRPEKQMLQHVIDISRTWARRPKRADIAAATRATTWIKRAYVSHFTATSGILTGSVFPTKPLISRKMNEITPRIRDQIQTELVANGRFRTCSVSRQFYAITEGSKGDISCTLIDCSF